MFNVRSMTLLVLAASLGAGMQSAMAQPAPTGSCQGALSALAAEWNEIAFTQPSKPAQALVVGREGYVTTGADFNFMTGQMRSAHMACVRGDEASAMQNIAAVRDILAHSNRHKS
jgi:hypothetical protein